MTPRHHRRDFLKAAAATGFWVAGTAVGRSNSPRGSVTLVTPPIGS
jgi:hypothetical protein